MLGIVLVSYNTTALTLECLHSIAAATDAGPLRIELIDNSTNAAERDALRDAMAGFASLRMHWRSMDHNAGFATASNLGIATLLEDPAIDRVLLLNNDATLVPGALAALLRFADAMPEADMFAARMHRRDAPEVVDSLGITLYASALASNRKRLEDRLLGPTGGLALYTRRLLETVHARHGYIFEDRYFCYAEDTDLALRAVMLGFKPAFFNRCVALHQGQASSGGGFTDFVLYHGIRNSVWNLAKDLPWTMLAIMAPLIVVLHVGIVLRHSVGGRSKVVWHLYRDAFAGLPEAWRQRRVVQPTRTRSVRQLWAFINPSFYDHHYTRDALRDLVTGRRTNRDHG